jgi:hypothetical protein
VIHDIHKQVWKELWHFWKEEKNPMLLTTLGQFTQNFIYYLFLVLKINNNYGVDVSMIIVI